MELIIEVNSPLEIEIQEVDDRSMIKQVHKYYHIPKIILQNHYNKLPLTIEGAL